MTEILEAAIVRDPLVGSADATVLSAVEQMRDRRSHSVSTCVVIVSDGQQVLGSLTERDVIDLVAQQQPIDQLNLGQFLQQHGSSSSRLTIPEVALRDVIAAISHFEQQQITHLPIVDADNRLVGLIQLDSLRRLQADNNHQITASLLASQQKILERIAKAEPLTDILNALLQTMESHIVGTVCSIILCQGDRLADMFGPSLPPEYLKTISELDIPIAEGSGSCGTAAFRQELVVVSDIEHDPLWHDYNSLVLGYGLQACTSIPIFASDRTLLGVFGIYNRQKKVPNAPELESVVQAANIAGIAIERDQSDRALQQLNQELESRVQSRTEEINQQMAAIEAAIDGIAILRDGKYVYLNQAHLDLYGYTHPDELIGQSWQVLYSPPELARFDQEIVPALGRDRAWQGEAIALRKDGSWLHESLSLTLTADDLLICVCQDITDRKNIELALQDSQAQFRRLAENVPGMIYRYVLLPDGRDCFTYVSPQILELYAVEADRVMQDPANLWVKIHPDDLSILRDKVQESAITLRSFVLEHRIVTPNGLKFAKAISQPEHQQDGSIFWDGIVIDITDLKLTELALQESQAQFRRMTENVPGMIYRYILHPDGSDLLTYVSSQIREIFELEPEAALQDAKQLWSRIHPDDLARIETEVQLSAAKLEPFTSEYRLNLPQKGLRWVHNQSHIEKLEDGSIVWDGVVLDSTERKNAAIALQDLSDRLEFALKGANIGIWECQVREGRLLWDDRMCALYGITPAEFFGKYEDWFQRVHPDDLDRVQQAEQQTLERAIESRIEFRIIRPDGTVRFIDSYAFKQRDAQGEIHKTIGLNIDITDRKQAEALLQQSNEELARATRLKDEFLANMSHELRTPLNAILGMTEILQEQIFGNLNEHQHSSLQTIEDSSNHLLELITDILDMAKIEAGHIELDYQPTNITALCQSSLAFIKQQAFSKNIQLAVSIPQALPNITIDERRIRQVLINLLNNAVKFTPNGGEITLEVQYVPAQCIDGIVTNSAVVGDSLEINVIDTGIGIPADRIGQLFQPFVQVDSALNRNYDGTGLGLALVKRLVELHGGRVGLSSELGVGSCFTISLPIKCPQTDLHVP